MTVSGASFSSASLRIPGGLLRYLLVRANTTTTIFQTTLADTNGTVRMTYDYHEGEIVDNSLILPVVGSYTVNITNASQNDIFKVVLAVQEN